MDNFFLVLAAILLTPVIPAFIIYKFLPASDTDVSGPYQGLSLKLKGAFAGYFLLVIVGLVLQYAIMGNKQEKWIETLTREAKEKDTTITQLKAQLMASANPVIDWKIKGSFWISGGYEQNYKEAFKSIDQLRDYSAWQTSGLIGISKVVSVKSKIFKKTKVQLLWDFLSYQQIPQSQPFVFRIGYALK